MIYLDYAAATPVSSKAMQAMEPYFTKEFFNPSSPYLPAKKVASDYATAKDTIGHCIGAKGSDIIITSGATEANNLAFTCLSYSQPHHTTKSTTPKPATSEQSTSPQSPQILYLETEHDSVRQLAKARHATPIKVLTSGLIDMQDLQSKITDNTELISISLVNNELGTIQPLAEVKEILREVKQDRMRRGIKRQLLLHSDASQAANLLDINAARLGIDLLTLNSAKVYGPKGIGALYVSHTVKLHPLIIGGGQEQGLRSGTENVAGVIGFATAIKEAKTHIKSSRTKYQALKQILLDELQGYELINRHHSIDNFLVICYNNIDAERLIFLLEAEGIYVATGAACAASKGQRSHVLAAIGLPDSKIAGSLRLSLGAGNDETEIRQAAHIINQVITGEQNRINSHH